MRNSIRALAITAVAALAPLSAQAAAPEIYLEGITRVELMDILSSYGMSVKDTTERESDPWLQAKTAKGIIFYVNMYECLGTGAKNKRCALIQFQTQWQNEVGIKAADVNTYNLKFVFGRASLSADGKSVVFDYPMNIKDGVTKANLKKNVDNWLRVLDDVRSTLKVL